MKVFQKIKNKIKQSNGLYKLASYWTAADTVEFDNGDTLEKYKTDIASALAQKGDGLFYDNETNMLYLLSGENRISGVEIVSSTSEGETILGDVTNISILPSENATTIKWTDPSDTQGVSWAGTIVLRKQSSRPVDCTDGEVVVDSTVRNQYQTNGYVDEDLMSNTSYFYRFFPYTTEGQIRTGLAVGVSTLKDNSVIDAYPQVAGEYVYNGSQQTVQLDNFDEDKMMISSNTATGAGTHTVTVTPKTGYKWPDKSTDPIYLDWVIQKAKISQTPSQSGTVTYTGSSRTPYWSGYDSNALDISGDTTGIDAGTYTVTFTPTENYTWSDGTSTGKTATWIIQRAQISAYPYQSGTLNYTGSSQSPTWVSYDTNKMTISGQTSGTEIGSYIAVFTPKSNYMWNDGTTSGKEISWSISSQTVSLVPTQANTLVYTGNSQSPTWNNYDSSKLTLGGTTSGTNATSYTATFTPKSGYTWSDGTATAKSATWSIGRATISSTPSQSGTLTYSGSSQSPTWSNYDSSKMTRSGTTSGTNAGTYTATFTPTSNYQWSGGSTSAKSVSWTIGKANGTLTLSKTSVALNSSKTIDTVTCSNNSGSISAVSSNTSAATVSVSGTTVTITSGSSSGNATITITAAAGNNYYSVQKTVSVTVEAAVVLNANSIHTSSTNNGSSWIDTSPKIPSGNLVDAVYYEGYLYYLVNTTKLYKVVDNNVTFVMDFSQKYSVSWSSAKLVVSDAETASDASGMYIIARNYAVLGIYKIDFENNRLTALWDESIPTSTTIVSALMKGDDIFISTRIDKQSYLYRIYKGSSLSRKQTLDSIYEYPLYLAKTKYRVYAIGSTGKYTGYVSDSGYNSNRDLCGYYTADVSHNSTTYYGEFSRLLKGGKYIDTIYYPVIGAFGNNDDYLYIVTDGSMTPPIYKDSATSYVGGGGTINLSSDSSWHEYNYSGIHIVNKQGSSNKLEYFEGHA